MHPGTFLVALSLIASAAQARAAPEPRTFLFAGGGGTEALEAPLRRADIEGIQVVYSWRRLEPEEGRYDFSAIEADLALADKLGKKLWVQLQDRFFLPTDRNVPNYLLVEPVYGGGLARQFDNPGEGKPTEAGWVARQWDPDVRARFQALIRALADRFDGRIYGINLPETAIDLAPDHRDAEFSCDAYVDAELENIAVAREAFAKSHVLQYVNFWPCEWNNDKGYMERTFAFARAKGIGLGGPDIVPWRQGQMKNAYPLFNRHKDDLPLIAMAVQEPTLTYANPETGLPFTRAEFVAFARDYLGVDIIFWTASAPWLGPVQR